MDFFDHRKDERVERPQVMRVVNRQHEYKKVAQWRPQRGHTIFEVNTKTMEIVPAKIAHVLSFDIRGGTVTNDRINVRKGCIYIEALNKKNVIKQLKREGLL